MPPTSESMKASYSDNLHHAMTINQWSQGGRSASLSSNDVDPAGLLWKTWTLKDFWFMGWQGCLLNIYGQTTSVFFLFFF